MSTAISPGCVILLVDESAGMSAVMGDVVTDGKASTKSNAERVATAINSLLNQLTDGPDFDLALVGYQTDNDGQPSVGSRWGGSLAGRPFIKTGELAANPLRVETRTRKIPAPSGMGVAREESVSFPVWYAPTPGGKAPQIAAFDACGELLSSWLSTAPAGAAAPLVVHIFSGSSGDGNPQMAIDKLQQITTQEGGVLLFQAHLAASAAVSSALYPSNYAYLTLGTARDLFRRSSPLPANLLAALTDAKIAANAGARGMLYNAKIADVIRLLGLVKSYTRHLVEDTSPRLVNAVASPTSSASPGGDNLLEAAPEAQVAGESAADTSGVEKAALILLVLDRSVNDPFSGDTQNPCNRLQEHANDLLKQISKFPEGAIDTAIVSYGLDSAGEIDVRTTFEGPLAGQTIVRAADLAAGALRVDQCEEEVSNGIGGLVTVTRKKPIYFDLEPTAVAPPARAFAAASGIVAGWCAQHPTTSIPPIVLHLTRGAQDDSQIDQAAAELQSVVCAAGPVSLYHLVVTTSPHMSLAYPATADDIEPGPLRRLWQVSSPLLGRDTLAIEKPAITAESRGMVINGKFDLLLDGVAAALAS